ncbi:helix-turn-helix domain-containing protein [Enterocloster lavalensis]|uniref:helix-turn-helix domain-containing protein n=1 Tax=Enterocloster lavalensis TaxID=460384 RepID=UPI0015A63ABE|nr:helix-turn-helix transcriptional regulator [Enterocloster lavalensis]
MRLNITKVRLLMAKLLISQASLAAKAGISRQTMSAVMNGRNCRPELLGKISNALGVEPEEIIE